MLWSSRPDLLGPSRAEPAWVTPIKEAVRARAAAAGVWEVTAAQDLDLYRKGELKVVNGMPSSILNGPLATPPLPSPGNFTVESAGAVEDEGLWMAGERQGMETVVVRRPRLERTMPEYQEEEEVEDEWSPSLATVEKAVATKVFFENHYCTSHL